MFYEGLYCVYCSIIEAKYHIIYHSQIDSALAFLYIKITVQAEMKKKEGKQVNLVVLDS